MEANAVRSGEKKDPSLHGGEEFSFDEAKDVADGSVSFRLLVHRYESYDERRFEITY